MVVNLIRHLIRRSLCFFSTLWRLVGTVMFALQWLIELDVANKQSIMSVIWRVLMARWDSLISRNRMPLWNPIWRQYLGALWETPESDLLLITKDLKANRTERAVDRSHGHRMPDDQLYSASVNYLLHFYNIHYTSMLRQIDDQHCNGL